MSKRTVLLTGGTGFIGSHCAVAFLDAGYHVVLVDNLCNSHVNVVQNIKSSTQCPAQAQLDLVIAEVGVDKVLLDSIFLVHNVDAVIHMAAHKSVPESVKDPLKYYRNNLGSLVQMLEIMDDHGVRNIVFSSSATVYGNVQSNGVKETDALAPTNPYGWTKLWGEQMVRDTCASWGGAHGVSLRYMNPYGSHHSGRLPERPKGAANNLFPVLYEVMSGARSHVDVFGSDYPTRDGTGERDFVHVCDVAEAHVLAVNKMLDDVTCPVYDVFNVGSGSGRTVLEVIHYVESLNPGVRIPYKMVDKRAGDIASLVVDVSKAERVLGWTPKRRILVE